MRSRARPRNLPLVLLLPLGLLALLPALLETGAPAPSARAAVPGHQMPDPAPHPDVEKFVGSERCAECHQSEHTTWKKTRHALGFSEMHRSERAKQIASALGIRRIKTEASCVKCHYTPTQKRGRIRASAGVSCESCHGPARDWLDLHDGISDVEGANAADTARKRQELIDLTKAHGMRRPDDLHRLVSGCFDCHVVDDAKLVRAGHPTGQGFELLAWTQGEVRHNFLESAGAENGVPSPARKRVLYALGQVLELRTLLRVAARATDDAHRADLLVRADGARVRVVAIRKAIGAQPEIDAILAATDPKKARDATALEGQALRLDALARRFSERESGKRLTGLDALLPPPKAYRGSPGK